jgi:hypothetical protein
VPRLAILVVTIAALAAVSARMPAVQLAVVATGLAAIAVVERHGPAETSDAVRGDSDLPIRDD